MYATDIKANDNRPNAYLIATAYPEIWAAFVARCEYERQFQELDARRLEPTPDAELVN
jgi:hypothetical protein